MVKSGVAVRGTRCSVTEPCHSHHMGALQRTSTHSANCKCRKKSYSVPLIYMCNWCRTNLWPRLCYAFKYVLYSSRSSPLSVKHYGGSFQGEHLGTFLCTISGLCLNQLQKWIILVLLKWRLNSRNISRVKTSLLGSNKNTSSLEYCLGDQISWLCWHFKEKCLFKE